MFLRWYQAWFTVESRGMTSTTRSSPAAPSRTSGGLLVCRRRCFCPDAVLFEELDHFGIAFLVCNHKGRHPGVVFGIDVEMKMGEKVSDHFVSFSIFKGDMESILSVTVNGIGVGAILCEHLEHIDISVHSSHHEWGHLIAISGIGVEF